MWTVVRYLCGIMTKRDEVHQKSHKITISILQNNSMYAFLLLKHTCVRSVLYSFVLKWSFVLVKTLSACIESFT